MEINIGIIAIVVLAIAILAILASGYVKASPNKAYIISGIKREPKVLIGRAGIKIPFLEKKDELILKQISIDIKTNGYIPTKDFIGVDIDAVAKVRVLTQRDVTVNAKGEVVAGADSNKRITTEMANAAMKNFLNMNEDQCEFPYKSRVMPTSEPLKTLKAPYMARNTMKWGFFRLKSQ